MYKSIDCLGRRQDSGAPAAPFNTLNGKCTVEKEVAFTHDSTGPLISERAFLAEDFQYDWVFY